MKLLFDQNISWRVIKGLSDIFPEGKQVRELGLEGSSDREIRDYAKRNSFAIVTFDSDFYDWMTLYGHPPKIIWLRVGNTSTQNLIELLKHHSEVISHFLTDGNYKEIGCLEIDS